MSVKFYVILLIVFLIIGYGVGKYTTPERIVTKTVIDTKTVTVVKHDTQTVIVEHPDGTKTTTTVDKSVDTTKQTEKETVSKTVENNKPQWHVSAQLLPRDGILGPVYGLQVERRILGPVFVGGFGNTDSQFGLSIGIEL